MDRKQLVQAALFDFVAQWNDDRAQGKFLPLSEYLARFPECEEEIAREFLLDASGRKTGDATVVNHGALDGLQAPARRYEAIGEIARGGMGRILRVRDGTLGRDVAMKVSLEGRRGSRTRLVEEAHVTGELDHPGVVPVHDMGADDHGRSFFTMRLVEGRDLREIIGMVHRREEGWSVTRALEVLLKVCDTLAFAHSRGVVHRDLKPSNIRVGSYGEVYVLDWGLAKTTRRAESSDGDAGGDLLERRAPSLTLDGDVIGTPCTMSPEQAEGRVSEVGPRSDVYSAGAMLYEILSGRMPFLEEGETPTSATVLERVRTGALTPLKDVCPKAPADLVSICEKAMARDPGQRYPDMREMASDLRAFLEQRVVSAHEHGTWPELVKWVKRNRWLSVAIASVLVVSTAAAIYATVLRQRNERRLRLVADSRSPKGLIDRFTEIRPDVPEQVTAMEAWLAEADDLLSRRDAYVLEMEDLRGRAVPWYWEDETRERDAEKTRLRRLDDVHELQEYYREQEATMLAGGDSEEALSLSNVRARLESLAAQESKVAEPSKERLTWRFADPETQFRYDTITALLPGLDPLVDSATGEGLVSRMRRRLDFARRVEQASLIAERDDWSRAIASIRDEARCPAYHGLEVRPQIGLIPLRRDPGTGLWEFLHLESGGPPSVKADGTYAVEPDTGIVLVLVPGGAFDMGAQHASPDEPNFDPAATAIEWTSHAEHPSTLRRRLWPFLLSKYEMTQAQWRRLTGRDPSACTPSSVPLHVRSDAHPVENVTWTECMQVMQQVGLALPTEAQWEYAARAGTRSPWWTGVDRSSLEGAANIADHRAAVEGAEFKSEWSDWPELDDGFALHAQVGSLRPNPFGLHDVCGNVSEWCRDAGATTYDAAAEIKIGTLERIHGDEGLRAHRGGSYMLRAAACRSSARAFNGPTRALPDIGLRPARDLDR